MVFMTSLSKGTTPSSNNIGVGSSKRISPCDQVDNDLANAEESKSRITTAIQPSMQPQYVIVSSSSSSLSSSSISSWMNTKNNQQPQQPMQSSEEGSRGRVRVLDSVAKSETQDEEATQPPSQKQAQQYSNTPSSPTLPSILRRRSDQASFSLLSSGSLQNNCFVSTGSSVAHIQEKQKPRTPRRVMGLWESHPIHNNNTTEYASCASSSNNNHHSIAVTATVTNNYLTESTSIVTKSSYFDLFQQLRDETLVHIFTFLDLADLLRASMVNRRFRYHIHQRSTNSTKNDSKAPNSNFKGRARQRQAQYSSTTQSKSSPAPPIPTIPHDPSMYPLWTTIDSTSFVQIAYRNFLAKRILHKQQQQQQDPQLQEHPPSPISSSSSKCNNNANKQQSPSVPKKSTRNKPPQQWAREQTSKALSQVLQTKTPTALRIYNIHNMLCASSLALPVSLLGGLQELTLTHFESLTDTHLHALLLLTLGGGKRSAATTRMGISTNGTMSMSTIISNNKANNDNKQRPKTYNRLRILQLEYCSQLTVSSVTSIAKTCHKHLRRLSLRGNLKVRSMKPLQELLVTRVRETKLHDETEACPRQPPSTPQTQSLLCNGISYSPQQQEGHATIANTSPICSYNTNCALTLVASPPSSMSAHAVPLTSFFSPSPTNSSSFLQTTEHEVILPTPPSTPIDRRVRTSTPSRIPVPTLNENNHPLTSSPGLTSLFAPPKPPKTSAASTSTFITPRLSKPSLPRENIANTPSNMEESYLSSVSIAPPNSFPVTIEDGKVLESNHNISNKAKTSASSSSASIPTNPTSSSSPTINPLESLFQPPGTSPPRKALNFKLSPAAPSLPPTLATPTDPFFFPSHSETVQPPFDSACSSPSPSTLNPAMVQRYHRHRRSLSSNATSLVTLTATTSGQDLVEGAQLSTRLSESSIGASSLVAAASHRVGSLEQLDIRETGISSKNLVACLWGIASLSTHEGTSHQDTRRSLAIHTPPSFISSVATMECANNDHLWCFICFRSLMHCELANASVTKVSSMVESSTTWSNPVPSITSSNVVPWDNEEIQRLQTVLAMDEVEELVLGQTTVVCQKKGARERPEADP